MPTPGQPTATVHHGDAAQHVQTLPTESIDAVITDPPYGLAARTDIHELLGCWLENKPFLNDAAGYGGEDWDHSVPGPDFWTHAYRALKPGGHVLAFAAPRTMHLTAIALQLAGFDIRDSISWVYSQSRMPYRTVQSYLEHDGHRAPAHLATLRAGLRPAHEPIIVARKPFEADDTFAQQMLAELPGGVQHDALTSQRTATNLAAVHDLHCTPHRCACDLADLEGVSPGWQVFPGDALTSSRLDVTKPSVNERPVAADGTAHLTVKPLALMCRLICAYTLPGHTVLDPFLGSGTTLEAALREGRNVIGVEADETYHELIAQRLKRATNEGS